MRDLKYRRALFVPCNAESQEQHNDRWGVHVAETPVRYSVLMIKVVCSMHSCSSTRLRLAVRLAQYGAVHSLGSLRRGVHKTNRALPLLESRCAPLPFGGSEGLFAAFACAALVLVAVGAFDIRHAAQHVLARATRERKGVVHTAGSPVHSGRHDGWVNLAEFASNTGTQILVNC